MSSGGINLANSTDLNLGANILKSRLSSEDYAKFISTLNSTRNAYQAILTSGGQTTPTSADASLINTLNENSSIGAIKGANSRERGHLGCLQSDSDLQQGLEWRGF